MWDHGWGWGGMMTGGGFTLLVFLGGIMLLVVLLARSVGGLGTPHEPAGRYRQTPLEILQDRFARGEIDKQEYEERRKTLSSN